MKSDIMQPIEAVLRSVFREEVISVLQVVVKLAFASDIVSQKMLTKDLLKSLKMLCAHKNSEASFYLIIIQGFKLLLCFDLISFVFLLLGAKTSFVSCWKSGLLL